MNATSHSMVSPEQLLRIALCFPRRWLIPALAVAVLTGVYALVRPSTWEASQALVIRNDAANSREPVGKFAQVDEMKTVQETILELVKSRAVLAAALAEVGPPDNRPDRSAEWPTQKDIVALRDRVKLAPPRGAEFGKTEVFYLKVRDRHAQRAVALASALCAQLEAGFQKLRDAKAASMVGELQKAVELAAEDLRESTERLGQIERQVGADLAELRLLHESNSGESALRRTITEIRNELRHVRSTQKSNEELLRLLKLAQQEPDRLVATPNTLLESQPALRRLKDGLIEAQLNASQLLGRMSSEHPLVKAAKESQHQIARHVHEELANAIRAVEVDLRLNADRAALLEEQMAAATGRLDKLAALRAPYANQVAETRKRTELLERAAERLSDARAAQATANATSLIARIDVPDPGTRPVGPSRAMLVLLGLAGGLVTGLGVLLLTVSPGALVSGSSPQAGTATPAGKIANLPYEPAPVPAGSNGKCRGPAPALDHNLSLREALERLAHRQPRPHR